MAQQTTQQVAGTIRAELARRSITGRALADRLGWSQSSAARRLRGEQAFTVAELYAVADVLGVPATSLLPVETVGAA